MAQRMVREEVVERALHDLPLPEQLFYAHTPDPIEMAAEIGLSSSVSWTEHCVIRGGHGGCWRTFVLCTLNSSLRRTDCGAPGAAR